MKKLIIISVIICIISIYSYNAGENLSVLKKKGFDVIEDQSFVVNFENWGKVKFISGIMGEKVCFLIADQEENILYYLPKFSDNNWFFYKIRAISFKDVNNDKLKDIIIIVDFITGVGNEGAIPFPVCSIYFQQKKEFKKLDKLDEQINGALKNDNIKTVLEFIKDKVDYINKLLQNTKQ